MADIQMGSAGSAETLTEREQEILGWLAQGLSNREIANRLHLAHRTVTWYNTQIYSKLGVNNRDDAVSRAQELGISTLSNPKLTDTNTRHNLPHQTTRFVGRQQELDDLARLIANPDAQLMTILAPGGMGKTRLGLAAAERQLHHFADGVYFVPLAPLSSINDIVTTIGENIGLVFHGEDEASQQLVDFLKERSMLLVLDNFEHLLDGAAVVTEIIHSAAHTKILVTSRERLNIQGEYVYVLNGLIYPDRKVSQDALAFDAAKLFMQNAKRTHSDFELLPDDFDQLTRICQLTAGMPLGIELAAGWIDVLSLEQIAAEIQQGNDILETELRDIPERHRSLQATFERTWVRLTESEQQVFMKLSVFRGGFTLESAERVVGATIRQLRKLAQKALIQTDSNERYAIHELLRQFGAGKLDESNELAAVQAKHAAYFSDFMVEREHDLKNGEQLTGLTLIDHDFENVRLAWRYLVTHHRWEQLPKFRYSLWFYCDLRSMSQDVLGMFDYALQILRAIPPSAPLQVTIGRMIAWSSWFYHNLGFHERATNLAEEAIGILQGFDDSLEDLIIAHHTIVGVSYYAEERASALSLAKHSYALAQRLNDPTWLGQTATFLAFAGDLTTETDSLYQAKRMFEHTGDQHGLWMCCLAEGMLFVEQHKLQEADVILKYGENLIAPFNSAAHLALNNRIAGIVALMQNDNQRAGYHFSVGLRLLWQAGYTYNIYAYLLRIAQVCIHENRLATAIRIMALLDDIAPELRDLYYHHFVDKRAYPQVSYDDLQRELEHQIKAAQREDLWEQVEQPTLSDLIYELLAEINET